MERLASNQSNDLSASVTAPRMGKEAVRAYVHTFAQNPAALLISNLVTRMETVSANGWLMPLSVNEDGDANRCYLCSPRTQYVDYAAFELSRLRQPLLEIPLRGLLTLTGAAFQRAALDRVMIVNNWLLSTNLYPTAWQGEGLTELVASLTAAHPGHAILLRSLNVRQNPALLPALHRAGARLLASRVVWHYDGADARFTRTSDYRRDLRLLENPAWEFVGPDDLRTDDMEVFARLYEQLYVEKYTPLNPRYTARYLAACHESRALRFQGLRERATGRWLGVVGIFERDDVMTVPIVGYDTSLPQALGLYRALIALVLRETAQRGVLLNLSAGAGSFKQQRGGVPCAEYTAVFDAHLPWKRQWPWQVLEKLSNHLALPLAWRTETGWWPKR